MKVGIITGSLPYDTRGALKKAKELGAHGVQPWVVNNDLDPKNLSKSGREELLTFLNSIGLELSALCGDIGGFANPATMDENVARTKQMFDLCVDLRTRILTTHIGKLPEDRKSPEYAATLAAVREVAEYAANRDCCFATETGLESGEGLAAFLREVRSEGAKVNFDPANLCMNGFNHLDDARALKPWIVHTHAKDGIYRSAKEGGYKEMPLGKGDVDFPRYLSVLHEIGYVGYLTIERECGEDPEHDISEAVRFLKTLDGVEP
jgi:L-ribulose-5-phosphate 3-epimerase